MQAFSADIVDSPSTSTLEDVFDLDGRIKRICRAWLEVGATVAMQRPSWLCSHDTVGAPSVREPPCEDV